jgi:osmotically-inducible protein OsmY
MTKFQIIASAAVLASSLIASGALAECSDAQFKQVGKLATIAVSDKIAAEVPVQKQKSIKITQCDAYDTTIKADFTYSYVTSNGLNSISGSVETNGAALVALNISADAPSLALNDESLTEVNLGPVKLR